MYTARPGLLIGFHGCDEAVRDGIINGQTPLRPSANKYDWLGHGIYFWESNADRALQFAQELHDRPRRGRPRVQTPAVLGAVIDLQYCLDLLDTKFLALVQDSYASLVDAYAVRGGGASSK